jgi:rhodanese-related sulfurtransferase
MKKKSFSLSEQLQVFEEDIERLETKIFELESKMERIIQVERDHLIRVKNKEDVSDEFLAHGKTYQDLSPEKAWRFYQQEDFNFIFVDVSAEDFRPLKRVPEALHIPWEEFTERFIEIQSRTIPIFIISEDGTNSILACEFLVKKGYYNCNNISGGYKHWKGFQFSDVSDQSA